MKNNLTSLNDYLFEELERLNADDELNLHKSFIKNKTNKQIIESLIKFFRKENL